MFMSRGSYAAPFLFAAVFLCFEWLLSLIGTADVDSQALAVGDAENSSISALTEAVWTVAAVLVAFYLRLLMKRRWEAQEAGRRKSAKSAPNETKNSASEVEQTNQAVDAWWRPDVLHARDNPVEACANKELIASLRMCLATRKFKDGLVSFDAIEKRIGAGCKTVWSMLLYCAVEEKHFWRCGQFIRSLLELGDVSGNDFVNIVRYCAHERDAAKLASLVSALRRVAYQPDIVTRNRALSVILAAGDVELAEALIEATNNLPLDVVAYNILIRLHGQRGHLKRCKSLLAEMRVACLEPSDITFGILIDVCVKCKDIDGASQAFSELQNSSVQPNVVHYTAMIQGLVWSHRLDAADRLLQEMLAGSAAQPDAVTYCTLMKAYSERGAIDSAVGLLKQMLKQGLQPDSMIFNMALNACSETTIEPKVVLNTFDTLVELGLRPNTATQSTVIKALVHAKGFTHAVTFLTDFQARFGRKPAPRVFKQLVLACQAVELYWEAKQVQNLASA